MQILTRVALLAIAPIILGAGIGPSISLEAFGWPKSTGAYGFTSTEDAAPPRTCPTTLTNQTQIIRIIIDRLKFNKNSDRKVRVIRAVDSDYNTENSNANKVKRLDRAQKYGSKLPTQYDVELAEAADPAKPATDSDYILFKIVLGDKMAFMDAPDAITVPKSSSGSLSPSQICGVSVATNYVNGPNYITFKVPAKLSPSNSLKFSPFNVGIIIQNDEGDTYLPIIVDPKIKHDAD